MTTRSWLQAVLACVVLLAAGTAASAQAGASPPLPTNDDCFACHADKDAAVRADGKTSVLVDKQAYSASVHGQMEQPCVACHAALADPAVEHPGKVAPANCAGCHEAAVAKYTTTVHGQARAHGRTVAAACADCHGTHDIRPSKDPDSRSYHLNLPATCGRCHGNDAIIQAGHLPGGNVASMFVDSVHGRALLKGGLLVAPSCASCHGSHDIRAKGDPESHTSRKHVPGTCGTCHEGVVRAYGRGKHGEQVHDDNPRAPICTSCHTPHAVQRAEMAGWQVGVIRECGTCHTESIDTYRDTFHGQVTALGFTRVATCASCHGAHEVLPRADERSPINPKNIVATCQKCHPGANANFAKYHPHANKHDREHNPPLYYTAKFMDLLLLGVFSFFGIHTGLWFTKEARVKRARRVGRVGSGQGDQGGAA